MTNILIADKMNKKGREILEAAGFDVITGEGLSEEELCEKLPNVDGLIVRSATKVTPKAIEAGAGRLKIIGRAGVGVDNINLEAATKFGTIVENTPFGNIISAAEHALALLMTLARNIPQAHTKMLEGTWAKKQYTGVELDGKTLGVIGVGKVGATVVRVGRALKMKVIVYDPYLTDQRAEDMLVRKVDLDVLYAESDFISVHTPKTEETSGMINADAFAKMKDGVRLVNAARGGIVDEDALIEALKSGKVAGAAVDVYSTEPYKGGPLCEAPNVILTPHLGASTIEAQEKVAVQVAEQFVAFFKEGSIQNAVNLSITLDPTLAPFAELAETLGKMSGQLFPSAIEELHVACYGKIAEKDTRQVALFALQGLLSVGTDSPITLVNAERIATDRGLRLVEEKSAQRKNYVSVILVTARGSAGEISVAGTLFENRLPKIVQVRGFDVDVKPAKIMLVMTYEDKPGMVGKIGTILGDASVNIADMAVGRRSKGKTAVIILTLDESVSKEAFDKIRSVIQPETLNLVRL